jgi:hypothetical protein
MIERESIPREVAGYMAPGLVKVSASVLPDDPGPFFGILVGHGLEAAIKLALELEAQAAYPRVNPSEN